METVSGGVVTKVYKTRKHPNGEKLDVLTLELKDKNGSRIEVLADAGMFKAGLKVVYLPPGIKTPVVQAFSILEPFNYVVSVRSIRGFPSNGICFKCSILPSYETDNATDNTTRWKRKKHWPVSSSISYDVLEKCVPMREYSAPWVGDMKGWNRVEYPHAIVLKLETGSLSGH